MTIYLYQWLFFISSFYTIENLWCSTLFVLEANALRIRDPLSSSSCFPSHDTDHICTISLPLSNHNTGM